MAFPYLQIRKLWSLIALCEMLCMKNGDSYIPEALLKESFLKCKESTLLEPGCIDYGMYQSLTDSTEFFIAETWKNDGELQKHGETAHLKQHLNEIKDMGDPSYKGSFRKIYVCPSVND